MKGYQNITDEPRQNKLIKIKEWFKNLTEEKRKDVMDIFLKGDEPKPKKELKQPFLKLSPEERKERRIERNRQYQLKNKELLKGKRQGKRKEIIPKRISLKSLTPEERLERSREMSRVRSYLRKGISPPPPRRVKFTPEELKERRREYYKKKWKEMTVEEKKKIYENIVRRHQNLTDEQKEEHIEKRKESHKIKLQNLTDEQREEHKEKKREYSRQRYKNMTDEQKEKRKEYDKIKNQMKTEKRKKNMIREKIK